MLRQENQLRNLFKNPHAMLARCRLEREVTMNSARSTCLSFLVFSLCGSAVAQSSGPVCATNQRSKDYHIGVQSKCAPHSD